MQKPWLKSFTHSDAIRNICRILNVADHALVQGAWGSSTNLLAGSLAVCTGRPVLLVVAHLDDGDDALSDLDLFAEEHDLRGQRFGALEVLPGESGVSLELLAERLSVVEMLNDGVIESTGKPFVFVAPIQALMQSVPEPATLADFSLTLREGRQLAPGNLLDWLDRAGYVRNDAVEQPGDFATRGGIVDIYAPSGGGASDIGSDIGFTPTAIRLDFFGDDIDSICTIDIDTLGSGPRVKQFQLIGATAERIQSDDRSTNLIQLLPKDTLVVLNETMELAEQARGYYERLTNPRGIYPPQAVFKQLTAMKHVQVDQYTNAAAADDQTVTLPLSSLPPFDHEAKTAIAELAELSEQGNVNVMCSKEAEKQRLTELIQEHCPQAASRIKMEVGYLHRGFVWGVDEQSADADASARPFYTIPHHELFHRYQTRRRIRRVSAATDKATDAFFDLEPGNHVVHVDHGIALFTGLKTMKRKGKTDDYLTLEFADKALLHVPATQIELIQKYIGGFSGRPPLSKLGGKRWSKQKEQARDAVKDLAAEMLRVQAARASMPGIRFPADTTWQKEFEAEFPYDETDDQLASVAAIKKDMADEQPMDRLICGDVGFGKTEVAIRAAFKAAEFGKQVAILVPTTVLAEQHERTFKQRMADYPFRVESISRFKTAADQKRVIKDVKEGRVDIVIGTHRLLSKDIKFADLGMVVIDEEQRFGVEHKQKLLEFRMTADVLTLSATPIPRTLHMSMLGLRDISSLTTPPVDRRAVVTEVIPYNTSRIKQAIIRELSRDGQVFFVHNRVHNIKSVAADIKTLVPSARIIIGHGQMAGHELEEVMLKFTRREADVLVSTTIIESGIDIPTANTMFINNADNFGLADLHQLRGRVGRYKHRAYCYLMLPDDRPITDKAAKRLKAIEQYSMLGAGFKIAMRDLEIRGAGNLLGPEQSGYIAAVGYQMYCHLLEQEAKRLRNEKIIEPVKTHIELPLPGRITAKYIPSEKHRMDTYRRLSRSVSLDELDAVTQDMNDAFGKPPKPVQQLIDLTEVRIAASTADVEAIKLDGPDLIFKTRKPPLLAELLEDAPGRATLLDEQTVYYRPPSNYLEPETLMAVLRKLLVRPLREAMRMEMETSESLAN